MTRILDTERTLDHIGGILHADTQRAAVGVDLTAAGVARIEGPGSLDFGGSEFETADVRALEPELRDPDDDYGWWELDPGSYLVRYNETLDVDDGDVVRVLPLERLLRAGASHAAFLVDGPRDPLETLLTVGAAGCRLKENCRISRALVVERG